MELKLMESLMQGPLTAFIAAIMTFAGLALKGKDIKPLVSTLVDEVVPSLA